MCDEMDALTAVTGQNAERLHCICCKPEQQGLPLHILLGLRPRLWYPMREFGCRPVDGVY